MGDPERFWNANNIIGVIGATVVGLTAIITGVSRSDWLLIFTGATVLLLTAGYFGGLKQISELQEQLADAE